MANGPAQSADMEPTQHSQAPSESGARKETDLPTDAAQRAVDLRRRRLAAALDQALQVLSCFL